MRKKIISLSMAVALCLSLGLYSMNKVFEGENGLKLLAINSNIECVRIVEPGTTLPE
ncbi:hypothetical protein [Clostridium sp.]|uniref:hypothetical protein n=1 Tax=Clostridium sp. TaxID=1506 RepID=UPI00321696DC